MKILTAAQMGEVDRLTSEIHKIPSLLLMESAGRCFTDRLESSVPGLTAKRIVVLCGKGNNGGDGFVVARYLFQRGAKPEVWLFADPSALKGDALTNWNIIQSLGVQIHVLSSTAETGRFLRKAPCPDVVVDALFGTGLSKPIGVELKSTVEWINRSGASAFVASVDIPSGLLADSPLIPGIAVKANLTVTFTALKPALLLPPAADLAGKVVVASIGSPDCLLTRPEYRMNLVDEIQVRRGLPERPRDGHKGTFGHVHVISGSRGKGGAALMTGLGALRSGAGLVTLWLAESLQHDLTGRYPELMTESLPETNQGSIDRGAADVALAGTVQADALVVGPGLSTQQATRSAIHEIVRRSSAPVVLDADGINAFASSAAELRNENGQVIIVTPHPGEMARLAGKSTAQVQENRLEAARVFAESRGCFVILKGYQTILATPAGQLFINGTGNAGMATGGTGDVLAGMTGRFVAAWRRSYGGGEVEALADYLGASVYLHGLAGDLAAEEKGMESLIATDLLAHLPGAFKRVCRP